jgi:glutamate N-acetyltransferase/amino-acid N-acetyltransferase
MQGRSLKKKIAVPGFRFSGISSGIKRRGSRDLALIYSESIATVSGLYTTNRIKAAPVKLSIKRTASKKGQAIIINSGNANACTGKEGIKDVETMSVLTARELGIPPELVYVSSTGVIGRRMPMSAVRRGIPKAVKMLSPYSVNDAASAIMTTDTFAKIVTKKARVAGATGTITGIAKGAGMICPNMATMLCFIVTDIAIRPRALDSALTHAVKRSFNRLTIDNDMSTNDSVIAMANGVLKNRPLTLSSSSYKKFKAALCDVTHELSWMISKDGEGSTKVINIVVEGARTESDAEKVARSIASSSLVKTAIYGRDPNWGRIMAAIGNSRAEVSEERIDIYINGLKIVCKGAGTGRESTARRSLSKKEVTVKVNLGSGKSTASVLTCDLTEDYVKINSAYST